MKSVIKRFIGDSPAWTRYRYAQKIRKHRKEAGLKGSPLSPEAERAAIALWRRYGFRLNTDWHAAYATICPCDDPHLFMPEDLFYTYIEPGFVRYELADAYADKNSYDRLLKNAPTLPVVIRKMNGRFFDADYQPLARADAASLVLEQQGAMIIKPSIRSGDGINVQKFSADAGTLRMTDRLSSWNALERGYGQDFLVQQCFRQHPAIAAFHPPSVNTIRFFTYRLRDDDVHIASSVLRLGNEGRCVDNRGIPCGVNKHGELNTHARTKYFTAFDKHPVTGKSFAGFVVPGFAAARDLVKRLHLQLPYFDAVSWDIAIGEDALPRMVELNLTFQEINFHQVNNGPLFGKRTEEVLSHIFSRQQTDGSDAVPTGRDLPGGVVTEQETS